MAFFVSFSLSIAGETPAATVDVDVVSLIKKNF